MVGQWIDEQSSKAGSHEDIVELDGLVSESSVYYVLKLRNFDRGVSRDVAAGPSTGGGTYLANKAESH